MSFGFSEMLLVLVIVLVLFGAGRISGVMGEFGKGLRSFKDGLKGEDDKPKSDHKGNPEA
jgi:sec-independent protein translocase protein TatA